MNPKKINNTISKITEKYKILLKYMVLGPSSLTKGEIKLLIKYKLLKPKFFTPTIYDIYFETHKELLEGPSRKGIRELTTKHLKNTAGQLIDAFVDKINTEVGGIVNDNLMIYHQKLKNVVPDTIAEGIARNKTVKEISRSLKDKMDNYYTNWDRIVRTELNRANNLASIDAIIENNKSKDFKEIYVYFSGPHDTTTCKHCLNLLFQPDGITPKVFKLSEVIANGTNYGRKARDWKAVQDGIHPNCFDKETEVLTNRGWKFFKDVDIKTDTFLSVNLESDSCDWIQAVNYIKYPYKGKMYFFKNARTNLMTTPDHNHVLRIRTKQSDRLELKCLHKNQLTKINKHLSFFTGIPHWQPKVKKVIKFDNIIYPTSLFCQFMGYWLSEGYLETTTKGYHRLVICQSSKSKYLQNILNCCEKLFNKPPYYKNNKIIIWINNKTELIRYFKQFGKSFTKYIPADIKNNTIENIKLFLNAYREGDGSIRSKRLWKNSLFNSEILYCTSSPQMAADIGELILKIGHRPSYKYNSTNTIKFKNGIYTVKHPCWIISQNRFRFNLLSNMSIKLVDYNDFVYDVELKKNHTLFVRRQGKVHLSGNCRHMILELPEGWGFKGGKLTYISKDHNEYKAQQES